MTDEQKELQNIAQQSMTPTPQETPPVDMEAFNLLAGATNMETQNINQSHSEGNRESMITPIQSSNGIGGYNPQNPLEDPAVMEAVMRQEMDKAQREVGSNIQPNIQPNIQQGFNNQPMYQQPPMMPQQPVYQQQQPQPPVQYGEGVVFPPNLQNIILSKIVAIEKTYAKIVEQQKDILKQLKSNGS
jgi:hypothetical protein